MQGLDKDEKGWFYTRGRMSRKPRDWEVAAGVSKKTYVSDNTDESKDALIKRLTAPGAEYVLLGDIWNSDLIKNSTATNYPTEKPEDLIKIIINSATIPGDLVLDCFIGSGTTAAVAQKLGRRWIGCDINKGAIQTTVKRIQDITIEQMTENITKTVQKAQKKITNDGDIQQETVMHPTLGFTVWRVNDYDLQIQHNEAVQLACEIIGIQRIRTDSFFEGILGKQLVKIIPFSHPLNPLDLEEIKRELESRPDEERNVTVVCLGIEFAPEDGLMNGTGQKR